MAFTAVVIFLVALAAPSFQQWAGGNSYIDGLVGNINKGGIDSCYQRCRDAYFANRNNFRVSGCVCSRYDFGGQSGPFNPRNCDCPIGTICQQQNFGRWTCVPRTPVGPRPPIGGSWGKDHCGYLSDVCRARPGDYNAVWRWTYDYILRACVKVSVDPSCAFSYGVSGNIFQSQADCSRQCEYNRSY